MLKKNQQQGTINIKWSKLSRIDSDDICAEDAEQVASALSTDPTLLKRIKDNASEVTAEWDLDSDLVSQVSVIGVKYGQMSNDEIPAFKHLEIRFSYSAADDADEEDIKSELLAGLIPIISVDGTTFQFFDSQDLSCDLG